MLPYLRMFDGVRKTWHRAGASDLLPKGWDGSKRGMDENENWRRVELRRGK